MERRLFLMGSASAALGSTLVHPAFAQERTNGRPPRVLLRGSWQSVNIGDVGHTPGALALFEKYWPEAEVTLWPGNLDRGAREMLMAAFPRLKIVVGSIGKDDKPTTTALAKAWQETDLYVSGSGSGFPAANHAVAFHKQTGKPVGVFAVSCDPISGFGEGRDPEGGTLENLRARAAKLPATHLGAEWRYIMDRAAFFFCRDSISRDYLKAQGVKCPLVEFGPDSQLGMHLRDDAKGKAWLAERKLETGKFICVIPRLRYTPYYKIRGNSPNEVDLAKDKINDRTTELDHAKLRQAIVSYIQNTGNKVLVCAEMTYQVEMGKAVLVDPLPDSVRSNVIWRDTYWMPDEAASIYANAESVVSVECHSPLIALHNGTPAIHVRQPTDTCKGQMYRDFGAGDWLFEVDEMTGEQLASRLAAIHRDPAAARNKVKAIMAQVEQGQQKMVAAARDTFLRVGNASK